MSVQSKAIPELAKMIQNSLRDPEDLMAAMQEEFEDVCQCPQFETVKAAQLTGVLTIGGKVLPSYCIPTNLIDLEVNEADDDSGFLRNNIRRQIIAKSVLKQVNSEYLAITGAGMMTDAVKTSRRSAVVRPSVVTDSTDMISDELYQLLIEVFFGTMPGTISVTAFIKSLMKYAYESHVPDEIRLEENISVVRTYMMKAQKMHDPSAAFVFFSSEEQYVDLCMPFIIKNGGDYSDEYLNIMSGYVEKITNFLSKWFFTVVSQQKAPFSKEMVVLMPFLFEKDTGLSEYLEALESNNPGKAMVEPIGLTPVITMVEGILEPCKIFAEKAWMHEYHDLDRHMKTYLSYGELLFDAPAVVFFPEAVVSDEKMTSTQLHFSSGLSNMTHLWKFMTQMPDLPLPDLER